MYNYEHKIKKMMVWDASTNSVHTGVHFLTQGRFHTEADRHMFRLAVEYNITGFLKTIYNPRSMSNMYIDITKEEFVEEINKNLEEID